MSLQAPSKGLYLYWHGFVSVLGLGSPRALSISPVSLLTCWKCCQLGLVPAWSHPMSQEQARHWVLGLLPHKRHSCLVLINHISPRDLAGIWKYLTLEQKIPRILFKSKEAKPWPEQTQYVWRVFDSLTLALRWLGHSLLVWLPPSRGFCWWGGGPLLWLQSFNCPRKLWWRGSCNRHRLTQSISVGSTHATAQVGKVSLRAWCPGQVAGSSQPYLLVTGDSSLILSTTDKIRGEERNTRKGGRQLRTTSGQSYKSNFSHAHYKNRVITIGWVVRKEKAFKKLFFASKFRARINIFSLFSEKHLDSEQPVF